MQNILLTIEAHMYNLVYIVPKSAGLLRVLITSSKHDNEKVRNKYSTVIASRFVRKRAR